ncbi:MAG: clan AA aspartic protease [Alphaproteobacteria bacterium]
MGGRSIYADLRLGNLARPGLEEINVTALVDTGALHLCIPEHVAVQLQLAVLEKREVQTADGRSHLVDYVGPVRISLLGRTCVTGGLVLGGQALLGAIPIEDMDLVIEPARQRLTVNPASPNIPLSFAKGIGAGERLPVSGMGTLLRGRGLAGMVPASPHRRGSDECSTTRLRLIPGARRKSTPSTG